MGTLLFVAPTSLDEFLLISLLLNKKSLISFKCQTTRILVLQNYNIKVLRVTNISFKENFHNKGNNHPMDFKYKGLMDLCNH